MAHMAFKLYSCILSAKLIINAHIQPLTYRLPPTEFLFPHPPPSPHTKIRFKGAPKQGVFQFDQMYYYNYSAANSTTIAAVPQYYYYYYYYRLH